MSENVQQLDIAALVSCLQGKVEGFDEPNWSYEKFSGGQSNPTFLLSNGNQKYVLRRQPPGKLLKSAHAVDREFKVCSALRDTAVPVPRMFHLCEDSDVIGSMFYLMEYCEGNIYWDAAMPALADNAARANAYDQMNQTLAAIHSVDLEAVGLTEYGKPGSYFERQLTRWTAQYQASETRVIPAMNELMAWLERELPEDDGRVSLVHGDFRLDNMMFDKQNEKVIAVLDWELSTLGHPFADLAYQCMQLRMPATTPGDMRGLGGLNRADLGIPEEDAYLEAYCRRMGLSGIDNWVFYLAFSFFRLAAIAQGVAKRAQDGNASSKKAQMVGAFVEPLALAALGVIKTGK